MNKNWVIYINKPVNTLNNITVITKIISNNKEINWNYKIVNKLIFNKQKKVKKYKLKWVNKITSKYKIN